MSLDRSMFANLKTTNDPEDAFGYWQRQQQAQLDVLQAIAKHTTRTDPETGGQEVDLAQTAVNGPNLFAGGVKLPSGSEIRWAFVENNGATATINVYAGSGGSSGRLLQSIKKATFKAFAIPDGFTSLSFVASNTTDTGVVRVMLSTVPDAGIAMGSAV